MIGYFVLGLGVLVGLLLLVRAFAGANPATLAQGIRLGGAGALGALALFLMVTGRFVLGLPLAVAAYGLWQRQRLPSFLSGAGGPATGRTTEATTNLVHMVLEHEGGAMRGSVRAGRFAGRDLGSMSLAELGELLAECRAADPQAVPLLETFIERAFGADSRAAGGASGGAEQQPAPPPKGGMSRAEALAVLGLAEGASQAEIKEAHRRLMLKLHPDQGGSTYLAAKLNQAKDLLMQS
ncbi:MAG: molecular chaperone DnaJ [Alphaproteobacteria bacterium]|nr:molecular chaperone DnaJ [Alphaproteobacteria bacterium]